MTRTTVRKIHRMGGGGGKIDPKSWNANSTEGVEGARNSSYIYFYDNGKIYYLSDNDIYTMSLDGSNQTKIKDNNFTGSTKAKYIYVYQNKVYYDDDTSIYRMDTNGANHETFIAAGYGMMRVYNDKLYYFAANAEDGYEDLKSIPLDKSSKAEIVVEKTSAYIGEFRSGNFYVTKDNTIFYYESNSLFRKMPGQTAVEISSGQNDNYVFAKDGIYFRDHSESYGISKGAYDATLEISATVVRKTDGQVDDNAALNISSSWIVYYNRIPFGEKGTIDLRYVSRDGKTERVLVTDVTNGEGGDSGHTPSFLGEIKIIGDYAYYMLQKSGTSASIYRIKKDGTDKKKLVDITLTL